MATWIDARAIGRLAGGLMPLPPGPVSSRRRGVGTRACSLAGVVATLCHCEAYRVGGADPCCQPPTGVAIPDWGTDASAIARNLRTPRGTGVDLLGHLPNVTRLAADGIRGRKPKLRYHATMVHTRAYFATL